jgi:hypothetical protein
MDEMCGRAHLALFAEVVRRCAFGLWDSDISVIHGCIYEEHSFCGA